MAYYKTEQVIAEIEGRRERIVAAAFAVISKHGAHALTSARVAKISRQSVGLIYKHFPDMDELRAHVLSLLLSRDVAVLREAGDLAPAIRAWMKTLSLDARMTSALAADAGYRDGMKRELAKMIRSATGDGDSNIFAAVVCGAVLEAAGTLRPRDENALTTALLRACGIRSRVNV